MFSYFGINSLAKKLVPWIAHKQLASEASVGKVSFSRLQLKLTIDDFSLNEKNLHWTATLYWTNYRGKAIQKTLMDVGTVAECVHFDKAIAVKGDSKTKLIGTKLRIDVKAASKKPN